MTIFAKGSGRRAMVVSALVGVSLVAILATGVLDNRPFTDRPVPDSPDQAGSPVSPVAPEAVIAEAAEQEAQSVAEPDTQAPRDIVPSAPSAPKFDVVRAEMSGFTLVSGVAFSAGDIAVMSGSPQTGRVLDEQRLGADRRFALFVDLDLQPGGDPVTLILRHRYKGGEVFSLEEVLISPPPADTGTPEEDTETASQPPAGQGGDQLADESDSADASTEMLPAHAATDVEIRPMSQAVTQSTALAGADVETADRAPDLPTGTSGTAQAGSDVALIGTGANGDTPDLNAAAVLKTPETIPQGPTVLLNSTDGIDVLQTAPLRPSAIALDAISYVGEDSVQISGRGQEDAIVRIYLDNAPVEIGDVQDDGRWRIDLPDIATGTYTLRVDQISRSGDVIARVESPFKREDPAVLAQAQAAEETGGTSAITVQPGSTLWAIARDRYGDGLAYVSVFAANTDLIRDPDLIYPGQVFTLPDRPDADQ